MKVEKKEEVTGDSLMEETQGEWKSAPVVEGAVTVEAGTFYQQQPAPPLPYTDSVIAVHICLGEHPHDPSQLQSLVSPHRSRASL